MRYLPLLLCLLLNSVVADISVVTSIRPLHQITASIMHGAGAPELLINDGHSAHHFAFKPSHFRLLQKADLVIWIDRNFEAGFQRLPQLLPEYTRQLELLPALGLENQDGHIWYSARLLIDASNHIATQLEELDADNRHIYRKNKLAFQQQVENWRIETAAMLSEVQPGFILDHDFLQHFEKEFGIGALAVIYDNHDQHGGIKALQHVEAQLEAHSAKCLISNEASISQLGRNLARQFSLTSHSLVSDRVEANVTTGIFHHLRQLTDILGRC